MDNTTRELISKYEIHLPMQNYLLLKNFEYSIVKNVNYNMFIKIIIKVRSSPQLIFDRPNLKKSTLEIMQLYFSISLILFICEWFFPDVNIEPLRTVRILNVNRPLSSLKSNKRLLYSYWLQAVPKWIAA